MAEPDALAHWHRVVAARDPLLLADLLTEDATFHSPIVHRPQEGRDLVTLYLTGAMHVLGNDTFRYVREVVGDSDAVLEFVAEVDGVHVNGVDMISWDRANRITDFKVMLRPMRAIELVRDKMAELLQAAE
ncbi:MAG: nuclear transport factor 2 family protein [Actinomycetia bacterium]|nr:nuclear transport factor 2 family protein [Actinomycetes bacterium]MCH9801571.1 nuclear transport factor 2 family protein [Actinomycetes bacterium]